MGSQPSSSSVASISVNRGETHAVMHAPPSQAAPEASGAALGQTPPNPADTGAAALPSPASALPAPSAAPAAVDPQEDVDALLALPEEHSVSRGSPGWGTLENAIAIPHRGFGFVFNTLRPEEARYGTVALVQTILRAAAVVEREMPGSGLVVNDLSLERGGKIKHHGSHTDGRDADILFYMLDAAGKPVPAVGVPIDPDGEGIDFKDLAVPGDDQRERLDVPRTWRFMQALFEVAAPKVQRIFIAEHVRKMLLEQADRVNAPREFRDRFAMVTCQPDVPHDDHLHLRLFCSPADLKQGCLDSPPLYPWHTAALAKLGLKPKVETAAARAGRRAEVAQRTTSVAEAKAAAGPMDEAVVKFLARRDHWTKQPHPGRPYCP